MSFAEELSKIIGRAEEVLSEYPLCNHCLGRLFAKIGVGIGNYERGLAIKTILAIKLHRDYLDNKLSVDKLYRLAVNAGEGISGLYEKITGTRVETTSCYICGGVLSKSYFERIAREACTALLDHRPRTFVVGITFDREILDRELEILVKHGIETSESIRRELKREIGKLIKSLCDLTPDFSKPDATIHVTITRDFSYEVNTYFSSIYYACRLWKTTRNIPVYTCRSCLDVVQQVTIEGILGDVFGKSLGSNEIRVQIGGFEGTDIRILGSGKRIVLEIKNPRRRDPSIDELKKAAEAYANELSITPLGPVARGEIKRLREMSRRARKIYRVSIFVPSSVKQDELREIEDRFKNTEIIQESHGESRGKRRRKIYLIKTIQLSPCIFEALIYCESGVHIKSLIRCDENSAGPCFSRVLGKEMIPLEIDLIREEE